LIKDEEQGAQLVLQTLEFGGANLGVASIGGFK